MANAAAYVARAYTRCRFGQLHYLEGRPEHAVAAPSPTLVLLHQNPSSSLEYEGLVREMARDRRVIAFDTPGYGMSDPPPRPSSIEAYSAAFSDAIDALALTQARGLDVFGYHTGALLAADLSLQRTDVIGRIVLSGIPMRDPQERAKRLREARATPAPTEDGAGILARSAALWRYVVTERNPALPLERAAELFAEKNRGMHRGWWAYEGVWSYDYQRLTQLTQPTLVLQAHEPLLEVSRAAASLIPRCQWLELPDLNRDIFELGVKQLADAMRAFLTPLAAPHETIIA